MDLSAYNRVQANLVVPQPAGLEIDRVRRHWDPAMAGIIAAHITVMRRVPDRAALLARLGGTRPPGPCRLKVGGVERLVPADTSGVFLMVHDEHHDFDALLTYLEPVSASPDDFAMPHITLLHPRTTPPGTRQAAWLDLQSWSPGYELTVDRLTVIGERAGGWEEIASFPLGQST